LTSWLRAILGVRRRAHASAARPRLDGIEVRVGGAAFAAMRSHVENFNHGEEAGFLLCGYALAEDRDVLLAREWMPVPEQHKVRRGRYGLEWTPALSALVLARADALDAGVVLVHSHDRRSAPGLSGDDRDTAERMLSGFSRLLGRPCGSVVLGNDAAAGVFYRDGQPAGELSFIRVVDAPLVFWYPTVMAKPGRARRRLDRQNGAIGRLADAHLAAASVAVIGVCGGGSHVCQQLAHQGVGRIVPIDDELVEEVNLGRMIGATPSDVDRTPKTAVMRRLISAIDPEIHVEEIRGRFPEEKTLAAVKTVDLVIACVDSFLVREQVNAYCRRHHLPLIDIGMNIETEDEVLVAADGHMIVALPGSACLRCTPLLSDAVLEREKRAKPPGYDLNLDALGDPQVVSMNGVLASEACNSALDVLTGYADATRGAAWWGYDGRRGELTNCGSPPQRRGCPACAEQGFGDSELS